MITMIDVENQVYTAVATTLRNRFNKIYVTGTYTPKPPRFPCVFFMETDNSTWMDSADSDSLENHVSVTYTADIYSVKQTGAKSECKKIASVVDEVMGRLGFERTSFGRTPNELDSTVYRITIMYEGIVSKDEVVYRR